MKSFDDREIPISTPNLKISWLFTKNDHTDVEIKPTQPLDNMEETDKCSCNVFTRMYICIFVKKEITNKNV